MCFLLIETIVKGSTRPDIVNSLIRKKPVLSTRVREHYGIYSSRHVKRTLAIYLRTERFIDIIGGMIGARQGSTYYDSTIKQLHLSYKIISDAIKITISNLSFY